jgi:hypothetical protein
LPNGLPGPGKSFLPLPFKTRFAATYFHYKKVVMINNMLKNVSLGKAFKMASEAKMDQEVETRKRIKAAQF